MKLIALFHVLLLTGLRAGAAESNPFPDLPPTEPADAIATFDIHPDFKIELVAAEPLIADPVAMSFDENGALYVVEMRDYSERRDEKLGRIKRLEDRDHDGQMDHATVFAEGLAWPTGVLCYDGGVFVIAAPDLWYFKDTDGDGTADEKRVVLTGFGEMATRLNVQALPNNIRWGPDQRIHIAEGGNGSRVRRPVDSSNDVLELRGRDLVFNPETSEFRAENGGGQFGMTFDDAGRKFVSSNSRHLMQVVYEQSPVVASLKLPTSTVDIAEDGPAAPVYRRSPDEAWRVARTKWRVAGLVPGPIEGGGTPSGYFTGATGLQVFRGDQFPQGSYDGDVFIADVGSNLIHHKRFGSHGIVLNAARVDPGQKQEFLASTDNWFRPVQLENGPDGGLYVVDFYREAIEHPWSLPPGIKEHVDLNRGNDRGRIWRITENLRLPARTVELGKKTTSELVAMLSHANGWHRDTAARLIFERNDPAALPLLVKAARNPSIQSRFAALSLLAARGGLSEELIVRGLTDIKPELRVWTLRLIRKFGIQVDWNSEPFREIAEDISLRSSSRNLAPGAPPAEPLVGFELLMCMDLSKIDGKLARAIWENIDRSNDSYLLGAAFPLFEQHANRWMPDVLLKAQHPVPVSTWIDMMEISASRFDVPTLIAWMTQVSESVGNADRANYTPLLASAAGISRVPRVAETVRNSLPQTIKEQIARGASTGIKTGGSDSDEISMFAIALRLTDKPLAARELLPLVQANIPVDRKDLVVDALLRLNDADVFDIILHDWTFLSPAARATVIHEATQRAEYCLLILRKAKADPVFLSQLGPTFRQAARTHKSESLRQQAIDLFGTPESTSFIQRREKYAPALAMSGEAVRGQVIYQQRCASCHRAHSEGTALGPDLLTVSGAGRESLLTNILDPNREVAPRFEAWTAVLTDGEEVTGTLMEQNGGRIVLGAAGDLKRAIVPADIKSLASSGRSLMPEGLDEGLTPEEMADLLRFIEELADPKFDSSAE